MSQPAPYHDRMAAAVGLSPGRALYQMRRPLPMEEHATIKTRPFRPGADEQAWLEVNNRAFHWHPEQGGWTEETIKAREAQPWFDPDGFLLYEPDDGPSWPAFAGPRSHSPFVGRDLRGGGGPRLCRPGPRPPAHPRRPRLPGIKGARRGHALRRRDQHPAVKLYVDLGFTVNHIDRAYTGDIAACPATFHDLA